MVRIITNQWRLRRHLGLVRCARRRNFGATNDLIQSITLAYAGEVEICILVVLMKRIDHNPDATEDDGSCIDPIYGCTDETANYNPVANR